MSHSFLTRRLVLASAFALTFSAGNAFAQADCSLDTDPDTQFDLMIFDTLDDLAAGPVAGPLVRTCAADSPTPGASYTLSASAGELRSVQTYKGTPRHAITTTDAKGVLRIDGFAPNINSMSVTAYGSDADGKYVPRTHLVLTVYAPDGSIIESRTFPGKTRHYSLGGTISVPIGAFELKMLDPQPTVDKPVFPTIEALSVAHDYGMLPR
jgi:hypothetical protein